MFLGDIRHDLADTSLQLFSVKCADSCLYGFLGSAPLPVLSPSKSYQLGVRCRQYILVANHRPHLFQSIVELFHPYLTERLADVQLQDCTGVNQEIYVKTLPYLGGSKIKPRHIRV